jgi:hypothetical protein
MTSQDDPRVDAVLRSVFNIAHSSSEPITLLTLRSHIAKILHQIELGIPSSFSFMLIHPTKKRNESIQMDHCLQQH